MSIITPPISKYNDYYKQGKFNLTWYGYLIFFSLSLSLTVIHFFGNSPNIYFTMIGLGMSIFGLTYMKLTHKYYLIAVVTVFVTFFITQSMIYTQINPDRTVDIMWIFTIALYAFYVLNYLWGILFLIFNFAGLIFWQYYLKGSYVGYVPISSLSTADQLDYFLNIIFGLIIISYLIIRFIKETNYASNQYIKTNFELNQTNKVVSKQNDEKTVMLKEIHHRVKNNLQIITSLLRLQSRELKDSESIQHFKDATNRVVAMALIHDKMYQSESLSKINLLNYLTELIDDLIQSYSIEIPIKKSIKSDIQLISPKSLVPIALIFNELVSNSLKHAFKTLNKGEIEIKVISDANNIVITYKDNGIWLEKQKSYSFGVELIETLTEQLEGELSRDISNGTIYTFKLPNSL